MTGQGISSKASAAGWNTFVFRCCACLLPTLLFLVPLFSTSAGAALRGEVPPPVLARLGSLLGNDSQDKAPLIFRLNRTDGRYEKGEILTLTIDFPPGFGASYPGGLAVYADYYLLDGKVAHLLPSRAYPENRLLPGDNMVLGEAGGPVRYEALAPFGSERLVVLATSRSLFPEGRPDFEDAGDYLNALEAALADASLIQAAVFTVETFDRRPEAAIAESEPEAEEVHSPDEPSLQEAALPLPEDPEPEAPEPAAVEDAALLEPELSEADIFYAEEVAPRLQRLADAGDDAENLERLAAAYGSYARLLAESGDHAKALRTLDFALALDFENPELTSLREEIAAAAP